MLIRHAKATAKILVSLPGKEGNLTFIIFFMIEVAISDQAFAGNAFDLGDGNNPVLASWLAVVTVIVVAGRDVDSGYSRNGSHASIYRNVGSLSGFSLLFAGENAGHPSVRPEDQ